MSAFADDLRKCWACVAPPEREAALAMADTVTAGAPFTIKELVKIAFDIACPSDCAMRWEIWQKNWAVETETVVIDEVEVEVLVINGDWMATLSEDLVSGQIVRYPPTSQCRERSMPNLP